jgi:hypothetical protein
MMLIQNMQNELVKFNFLKQRVSHQLQLKKPGAITLAGKDGCLFYKKLVQNYAKNGRTKCGNYARAYINLSDLFLKYFISLKTSWKKCTLDIVHDLTSKHVKFQCKIFISRATQE